MTLITLTDSLPVVIRWVLALVLLMLAMVLLPETARQWLAFVTDEVRQGQWWRVWSGHWLHLNGWHWAMNSGALLLISWIFRDVLTLARLALWWLLTPLLISVSFVLFDAPIHYYVGLSGALYGLLVMCLLLGWRGNLMLHLLVLVVVAGRLLWEQTDSYDPLYLQPWIDGIVHVNAHAFGALAGVLLALLTMLAARCHRQDG